MKSEYNKEIAAKHLREIFEESGMKQGEFGRKVLGIPDYDKNDGRAGYSDRYTSEILNGHKNLSPKKAERIVSYYPYLRIEWVRGQDEYKTETERIFKQVLKSVNSRNEAFFLLAELCGYHIYLAESNDAYSLVEGVKEGYKVQYKGEVVAHIPVEKINLLSLDIQELVEQRIKSYIRDREA